MHVSTGCLYDPKDDPQAETDFLVCRSRYAVSKWVGENGLDFDTGLIVRPGISFTGELHRRNLLVKLRGFSAYLDEPNSFTHTSEMVEAVEALVAAGSTGTFNVACVGYATIYELARWAGLNGPKLDSSEPHRREGIRLVNASMDVTRLQAYYMPRRLGEGVLDAQARLDHILPADALSGSV